MRDSKLIKTTMSRKDLKQLVPTCALLFNQSLISFLESDTYQIKILQPKKPSIIDEPMIGLKPKHFSKPVYTYEPNNRVFKAFLPHKS